MAERRAGAGQQSHSHNVARTIGLSLYLQDIGAVAFAE